MKTVAVRRTDPASGRTFTDVYSPAARFLVWYYPEGGDRPQFKGLRTKPMTAEEWTAGRVAKGWEPIPAPFKIGSRVPGDKSLRHWSFDGVAKATDGCRIEPDGWCHHGAPSWLLVLNMI
jgi:hypothetical protein